jgi:hypothetical protein
MLSHTIASLHAFSRMKEEEKVVWSQGRAAMRRHRDDDEEWLDDEEEPASDTLLEQLENIERCQRRTQMYLNALRSGIETNAERREIWDKFLLAGGVTAADLRQYLAGKLRPCVVPQKRHLRLVSSRNKPKPRARRLSRPGNDAA